MLNVIAIYFLIFFTFFFSFSVPNYMYCPFDRLLLSFSTC